MFQIHFHSFDKVLHFLLYEMFESLGPIKRIIAKILLIISDCNFESFDCGGYDHRLSYKTSILSTVNT